MDNVKIYENFLGINRIKGSNEKFNFRFNTNESKTEFEKEFLKFVCLYNYFFFCMEDNAIATIINSYPCALDIKTIKYLEQLYETAKIYNKNIYRQMIAEFLFSYRKSLETEKYKRELGKENAKKYKGELLKIFAREEFEPNGEIFKNTIKFYKNIINYKIRKKISIDIDQKIRILSKFEEHQRQCNNYKKIFDYILSEDKLLSELIKYDYDVTQHLTQYKNKILNSTENSYSSEEAVRIFKQLIENTENEDKFIKTFINKYIKLCNQLIKKAILKQENSIIMISNFEQIIKELNQIKRTRIRDTFKEKINECICKVLCIKRKILNDTEYVNSHLQEHKFEFKIPNKKVENMRTDILNDFSKLYPYAKIEFNNMMSESIKSYSEHPMMYLFTNITIGNNELYYINKGNSNCSAFKDYYDTKGKEYTKKNSKKLRNILQKDYYENMLKYIKTEFNLKLGLIASIMYKDIKTLKSNIDLARLDNNIKFENLYVEMAIQIIGIEVNIYKLLKINNLEPDINIEKNLEKLFIRYSDNDFYRNAIMNIYYILYCNEGYQLRDEIMHGDIINQPNYVRELIMIYTCMIAINYMVSNAKNQIK